MNANELRIGNYFTDDSKTPLKLKIIGWDEDYECYTLAYGVIEKGKYIWIENAKPIPLTEEWLIKFGFDEIKYNGCDIWKLKDQSTGKHISFVFYNEELYTSFDTEPAFEPIKYVHKLQNLYFALTGEELTIKTN